MSPEVTYDPTTGQSHFSRGGIPIGQEQEFLPTSATPEEIEDSHRRNTARGLAMKAARVREAAPGEYEGNLQAEQQLLDLQQKLANEPDSLKAEILEQQCNALAAQLVGAAQPQAAAAKAQEQDQPGNQDVDEWTQQYIDANPGTEQDLAYAAEVMSPELAEQVNSVIASEDEGERIAALSVTKHLRSHPQAFVSASESTGISSDLEAQIATELGEETAHAISVLGNGVAQGVISTSQAIRTASRDPRLMAGLMTGVQRGWFRIAL